VRNRASYAANFGRIETESNRVHARSAPAGGRRASAGGEPAVPHDDDGANRREFRPAVIRVLPHRATHKRGPIPAYEMIKHSVNCTGAASAACSFCTISAHQGKFVSAAAGKILREVGRQ